jgi:protein-disulfide isomerase
MRRVLLASITLLVATFSLAQEPEEIARRFTLAYLPYSPGAVVDVKVDARASTPSGPYIAMTANRTGLRSKNPEPVGIVLDPTARVLAAGMAMPLPPSNPPLTEKTLPQYVQFALPQLLQSFMGNRMKIGWAAGPARPSALIPLVAEISTGYGTMHMPLAITSDGAYLVLGATWPADRDPRAVRREILNGAMVQWDPGHDNAVIKVIEFSDFQCPACKHGWAVTKDVLKSFGDKVHHGMVNYPLTNNHPWAFKAAVAGECVGTMWPDKLLPLKEEYYRLQDTLTLETVDKAALGFLSQQGLPEKAFLDCYMKDKAMDAVLRQMDLGQRLGVTGTPTYYCNGEIIAANKEWMTKRLQAILDAKDLPENAAEIQLDPEPTPNATPKPGGGAVKK